MKRYIFISFSISGLVIFLLYFYLHPKDNLQIYFLDVGQGDSALISYPTGERLLIDTGKTSKIFRELDKVLPWYEKTIDYIMLSHGDLDHVGMTPDILDRYKVKKIFANEFFGTADIEKKIIEKAKQTKTPIEKLTSGDLIIFPSNIENKLKIINPDSNCMQTFNNENDCSLVGLLTYGSSTILFTGDISKSVETKISPTIKHPITILKVAHHGSKNSTDENFIQKIKPYYSVISVGENSYGHPAQEVISTLQHARSTILNTKEDATFVASSNGLETKVRKLFDQSSFFQSSVCTILLYGFDSSC